MELTSKEKGNLTELQCMTEFYKAGYRVSIPYGENSRYDMILDVNGHLLRVQCKTSKAVSDDCLSFACRSTRVNSQGSYSSKYTKDEIDYFSVRQKQLPEYLAHFPLQEGWFVSTSTNRFDNWKGANRHKTIPTASFYPPGLLPQFIYKEYKENIPARYKASGWIPEWRWRLLRR